jgi:hypothetical protein
MENDGGSTPAEMIDPGTEALRSDLAVIEALTEGVHPMSGEDLGEESIFGEPQVQRALKTALKGMEGLLRRESRQASLPTKAGKAWDSDEDEQLVESFEGGMKFSELAKRHGRTSGAIRSRLTKLGKLMP